MDFLANAIKQLEGDPTAFTGYLPRYNTMTIDDETLPAFIPLPVREFTWLPCWLCGLHMGGCGCEVWR